MKTLPDYIAIKIPGDDFFTWYDRRTFPPPSDRRAQPGTRVISIDFAPSGKLLTRKEDGAVAEIWESIQPLT